MTTSYILLALIIVTTGFIFRYLYKLNQQFVKERRILRDHGYEFE
jgi:hypothetical protein